MSARPARGGFGIGEVLAQLRGEFPDVSVSKIRFLESEGLIQPARSQPYQDFTEVVTAQHADEGFDRTFEPAVDVLAIDDAPVRQARRNGFQEGRIVFFGELEVHYTPQALPVIPGRREAASPESIIPVRAFIAPPVVMDSGQPRFARLPE